MKRSARPDDLIHLRSALHVLAGGDAQRLTLARRFHEAPGRVIEQYAAVPSVADPRVLLPLNAAAPALRAALGQHAAGAANAMARAAARLLGLASRIGLARPLLYDRVSVVCTDDLKETPLHAFFGEVLGRKDFVTSLRLAPRRPNGKPVIQVLARDGSVLAYGKFGWDPLTCRLVRLEAAVLNELASLTRDTVLQLPRVLHAGSWQGLETLVLAPLEGVGTTPRSPAAVPVATSVALAGLRPRVERLDDSTFWRRTKSRIAQVAPVLSDFARSVILKTGRAIEDRWGDLKLPVGQVHGDWIPPNMLIRRDGKFNVWDWERSVSDGPLGIDAVQFILFLELRRRQPYRTLTSRVGYYGEQVLSRCGLDPGNLLLLTALSLLETILWFGEAKEAGRQDEEDERFIRALSAVLDQL